MALGDSVFMRLKAILEADTDDLSRGFAEARREAAETAAFVDRQKGTAEFDAKIAEFEAKADYVEARMREIDSMDAEPEIKLKATKELERQAQAIESKLRRLNDQRALRELGDDTDYARFQMSAFNRENDRTGRGVQRNARLFGNMGKSLSDVRIQLGFASLNVKQLGAAMVFLSPILSALLGTASAMIGTIGSGLAGAAAIGGAGLSGLALGALGLIGALSGADKRFKALGKDWQGLLKDFQGRTGPARDSFFNLMADGLERARALMPSFAAETNKMGQGLEQAGKAFLGAFDAGEMKSTISTIMSAFSGSLPQLGAALGNIAEAFANIFASASRYIQPVTDAIADWAKGFSDATSNSGKLNSVIDGMADSAESLIHFLAAAGRLMVTFFGSGADEGRGLFDDMTQGLNDWNAALKTTAGQESLNDWFADSIGTVKQLFSLLESGVGILGEFARAFEPISDGAMMVLEVIGDLVRMLMNIPGGSLLLTALGGAAGLSMAANMIGKITSGLKMLLGGSILSRLLGAGGRGGVLPVALGGPGSTMSSLARFAPLVFNPFTAGLVAIGAAAYGIQKALGVDDNPIQNLGEDMKEAAENQARWLETIKAGESTLRTNRSSLNAMRQSYAGTIQTIRKGGQEGKSAFIGLKDSIQQARQPLVEQQREFKAWGDHLIQNSPMAALIDEFKHDDPVWQQALKTMSRTGEISAKTAEQLRSIGVGDEGIQRLREDFAGMGNNIERVQRQVAALDKQLISANRAAAGKSQLNIGTEAIRQMENLIGRQRTLKFLMDVDTSKAASKISNLLQDVTRMGGRQQAIEIMANTDGAQAKIRQLQQLKQQASKPITFVAKDAASSVINGIRRAVNNVDDSKTVNFKARDAVSSAAKTAANAVNSIPNDHNTNIRGDASQAISTARAAAATISAMTAVINVIARVTGMPSGARAEGGPLVPQRGEIPGYASGGGYIKTPMFMVGEEAPQHPEFVIATNPAYRRENIKYWFQAAHKLGIPGFAQGGGVGPRFRMGSIPIGSVQRDFDQARDAYQKSKSYLDKLQDKANDKEKGNNPSKYSLKAARDDLRVHHDRMELERRQLQAVKAANKNIDKYGAEISLDSSKMALWQERGNTDKFLAAKSNKLQDINTLLRALKKQAKYAKSGQFKTEILDRIAQLRTEKTTTSREVVGANALLSGKEVSNLALINQSIAEAQLTSSGDDDIAANKRLQDFWQSVYNRLVRQKAAPELITEAANNLFQARESGGGMTSDEQNRISSVDTYNQDRLDLYRSFGGNAIMGDALRRSPFGAAPGGAGGSSVTQHINFLTTPTDPHSWANQAAWEAQAAMT